MLGCCGHPPERVGVRAFLRLRFCGALASGDFEMEERQMLQRLRDLEVKGMLRVEVWTGP